MNNATDGGASTFKDMTAAGGKAAFPIPVLPTPRVTLPDVDRDAVTALHAEMDEAKRLRWLFSLAMVRTGKHIYAGTVPSATRRANRKRNKAARAARRVNR